MSALLFSCLLSVTLLTGCGAGGGKGNSMPGSDSMQMADSVSNETMSASQMAGGSFLTEEAGEWEEEPSEASEMDGDNGGAEAQSNRKLIRNVDLSVETKEFDTLFTAVEEQVQQLGGYIENMNTYNGSSYSGYRSSRYSNLTIRIPQNKLNGFLETISDISNVVNRSDSVEDVTLTYVDLESHRDALRTEQKRLLELLEKAESLEDILIIEERLTNVRYELESMESRLRTMDNQVDYSTVYLNISEVQELTPVEEKTTGQRIVEGFLGSLEDIAGDAVELFVWFVINLPHLVIWAAVVAAVIVIAQKQSKKKKAKREKELQEREERLRQQREKEEAHDA